MMLAILTPEQISKLLGSESGWYGVLIAAVIGSITLIPGSCGTQIKERCCKGQREKSHCRIYKKGRRICGGNEDCKKEYAQIQQFFSLRDYRYLKGID